MRPHHRHRLPDLHNQPHPVLLRSLGNRIRRTLRCFVDTRSEPLRRDPGGALLDLSHRGPEGQKSEGDENLVRGRAVTVWFDFRLDELERDDLFVGDLFECAEVYQRGTVSEDDDSDK